MGLGMDLIDQYIFPLIFFLVDKKKEQKMSDFKNRQKAFLLKATRNKQKKIVHMNMMYTGGVQMFIFNAADLTVH